MYDYDDYDYGVSSATEQRHLISPETSVLSGRLYGQHLPEKQRNLLFWLTRPRVSLYLTRCTLLI
jgi:hypothetical protein